MNELKWYMLDQNNSGGYFDVDDKVCHRLFIQAQSDKEAIYKAEELGCYWYGVESGIDCPCCGDRWSEPSKYDIVDIERYKNEGYKVSTYSVGSWYDKYRNCEIIEHPTIDNTYKNITRYSGTIKFNNIEEYAQYLADEYGWTVPDARIYYENGEIVEIFSQKAH